MKKPAFTLPAFTMMSLLPLLPLAGLATSGCENESATECVVGTPACRCNSAGACLPGLVCSANVCTLPSGSDAGVPVLVPAMTDAGQNMTPTTNTTTTTNTNTNGPVDPMDPNANDATPTAKAKWTVFVYGHGDHNLSQSLARDLGEMNAAIMSKDVNVVFLADWNATETISENGPDKFPAGAFWYQVMGSGQKSKLFAQENELNLDSPKVMTDTIATAFKKFPAERYGLVLWDHGGGWQKGFGSDTQDGTLKAPAGMSVDAVARAVRGGLAAAGLTGKRALDFLAFDTCLLGTTEVATEFSDITKVFIANAELDYGDGLDYENALTWLAANPNATGAEFAIAEGKTWDKHHQDASMRDNLFRSHVAIDTGKFDTLVGELANVAAAARGANAGAFARALYESMPSYHKTGNTKQDNAYAPSRDIGTLFDRIKKTGNAPLTAAVTRAEQAAAGARLGFSAGLLRQGQYGVSTFGGPVVQVPNALFSQYPMLAAPWERATKWGDTLRSTKAAAPTTMPVITGTATVPAGASLANPPRVDFTLSSNEGAMAELELYQADAVDPNRVRMFGTMTSQLISAGAASAKWQGRQLVLSGSQALPVFSFPWSYAVGGINVQTPVRGVPGVVHSAKGRIDANLLVDDRNVGFALQLFLEEGKVVVVVEFSTVVSAFGTSTFMPDIVSYDTVNKKTIYTPSGVTVPVEKGGMISFTEQPAPAGRYFLVLGVDDAWGNSVASTYAVELTAPVTQ